MDSNRAAAVAAVHIEENEDDLRNDYYCWICHIEGEMVCCDTCPKVYHKKCLENLANTDPQSAAYLDLNINSSTEWKCHECYNLKRANEEKAILKDLKSRDQFYLMLMSAVKRLYIPNSEPFQNDVDQDMFPDYRTYIYNPMNLSIIKKKIKDREYLSLEGLVQDVKWIVHNCIIYNSEKSKLTEIAKSLLKIVYNDVNEIEVCSNCYLNYVTKKDDYWFSEPCEKPHLLVWAKTRGFPFWPGKVLRAVKGDFDIRFFGALHDRSLVQANKCYWLSKECPAYSRANNSMEFKVSIGELNRHIEKLILAYGSFNYAPIKMECDINNPFTFVDKFPGNVCLVVINDNSKSTRKRHLTTTTNSNNTNSQNNNNPTTSAVSISQPASPSLSTSSQSLSLNDSSSNHPTTTNDAKKSRMDISNEYSSFSLDDSSNQMNSSSNNTSISKRSTRIRKHSDRYLNYSIETQNQRRNQIQILKPRSNESLSATSNQQAEESPLVNSIRMPQIKSSDSMEDDSIRLIDGENSNNLDSSLNEDIDIDVGDEGEEDEELKQRRKIKELKKIEKKLLKEKQRLEIDLNSKASASSTLQHDTNSNDASNQQQQPLNKPIKIKISLNQGEGSCASSVSVSENEQQSSNNNNTNKIALNLGELVRNCKTKLGLINNNSSNNSNNNIESSSNCSTPNQNQSSDKTDKDSINNNSKNLKENTLIEKSNEDQQILDVIQEEEDKQTSDKTLNEKSNNNIVTRINTQRDFEIESLRKTLDEYKKMVELKNRDLIQMKQSFEDIVREIKWNNDLKIKEIINECGKEKIRMQFFYENKIKDIKKRQWCANCGKEAIYYCCWNTSYCDEECQKEHWSHHLKTCNRISSSASSINLNNFNSDSSSLSNGNSGMLGASGQACSSSGLMNYESADSSDFILSSEFSKTFNNSNQRKQQQQQANRYYSNGNPYYDQDITTTTISNTNPAGNHFRLIQPKMNSQPNSNNMNRTK